LKSEKLNKKNLQVENTKVEMRA